MRRFRAVYELLRDAGYGWYNDNAPRMGAALAYYSVFSIAPLIVIVIGIAGIIFGKEAAQGRMVEQIQGTVGGPVAHALQDMLAPAAGTLRGTWATVLGVVTLLFGAGGAFGELQTSLNTVWKVTPKPGRGIWGAVRDRFLSLTMVLGTGFLLLVSLVISAALAGLSGTVGNILPGGATLWWIVNLVVSFGIITLLFAMIYRYLPDVKLSWRDVWVGAAITALLFALGKFLLGWYLGRASTTSAYGAAGSLVVILLWVYYASQILIFGAEFTRVYVTRYGPGVKPSANAEFVSPEAQAQLGIPRRQEPQQAGSR